MSVWRTWRTVVLIFLMVLVVAAWAVAQCREEWSLGMRRPAADGSAADIAAAAISRRVYLPITVVGHPGADPHRLDVQLSVVERAGLARSNEPVTSGVPIPKSVALTDLSSLRLLNNLNQAVPAQFTALVRG